jgi:rhodanese-related sulfurtransferase
VLTKQKMMEVTPLEVANRLKRGEGLNIIDVREQNEVETGRIPGAKHIPLGEILTRLDELDHGEASEWLINKGFKVINMSGGMLKWEDNLK